jgi:hypothetical protein
MDAKPLIDRLLHATAAFRQRPAVPRELAGTTAVDEQPLADLAFARELKRLRYVEDGYFIVAALRTRFEDWATKYEAAGSLHGIGCLHDRAKVLRMIADSFQDAETTIRTFVEIEQERTREATAAKRDKNAIDTEARRGAIKAILAEKGWWRSTPSLPKRVWSELAARRVHTSPRTVERDLKAIFDTSSL